MVEQLRHRGPDDAGIAGGEGWELGFRRLSILDLSPLKCQKHNKCKIQICNIRIV
jgi:asparagine synthetase B (glutamine-hydrolysing)